MKCIFYQCEKEAAQGFQCCNTDHGFAVKTWRETLSDPDAFNATLPDRPPRDWNLTLPVEEFQYYHQLFN